MMNQYVLPARSTDDEQPSALWRILLEQYKKCLQRQVGVSRTDRTVVEQTFNVVDENAEGSNRKVTKFTTIQKKVYFKVYVCKGQKEVVIGNDSDSCEPAFLLYVCDQY